MTTCTLFAKTRVKIFNSVFSRVMGLQSSNPSQTCLPPFFSNVILPKIVRWANQWLNISVRIGKNMFGSLKNTSYGKPSSASDLLRSTCFNVSRSSHSVTTLSQLAVPRRGKSAEKLLKRKIRTAGKVITKVHPKGVMYLTIRPQHAPIRGLDGIDIPTGKSSHFFLTRSRVRNHSFVEDSF